jgi:2',3'-cyclic-nucleotide 2'-phosphodiesterase (5'-nucleotidase family)
MLRISLYTYPFFSRLNQYLPKATYSVMSSRTLSLLLSLLIAVSCSVPHQPTQLVFTHYKVNQQTAVDTGIQRMVKEYGASMNIAMGKVIGFTNNYLYNKQPESNLGNLLADCIRQMAAKKFGRNVDAGFINKGGIRGSLQKGNITVGQVFEIMPFDNQVVLQEIKGAVFQEFLNKTAADGGWPVSGTVKYLIKDKKAVQVMVNGKPLEEAATYTIVNSDYVANGGSDCSMLKNIPKMNKGYLLRDAIIDYIIQTTGEGKPVEAKLENRVSYAN